MKRHKVKTYRVHFPGTNKRPQYGKIVNGKFIKETWEEFLERSEYMIEKICGSPIPEDHVVTDQERRRCKAMILARQMQGFKPSSYLLGKVGKVDLEKYDQAIDEHNRKASKKSKT